MPSLDELLGLINPVQPVRPPVEDDTDENPIIKDFRERLASLAKDKSDLETREKDAQRRMGVTPVDIQKQMIEADKPKGFWKTLGKYGQEALIGATSGRGYTPYSERMYDKAVDQKKSSQVSDGQDLASITQQKNNLSTVDERLRNDAARHNINIGDLEVKNKAQALKGKIFEDGAAEREAKVKKLGAQTGQIDQMAALLGAKTEGQGIKNINDTNNEGLNNFAALTLRRAKDPTLDEKIFGVNLKDMKAKESVKPPKTSADSFRNFAGAVDPVTMLPLLINKQGMVKTATLPSTGATAKLTGENAGAVSRSVSGYNQISQLEPTLEAVAKKGKFGLLKGGFDKYFAGKGMIDDPDIAKLVTMVDSISKFGVGIHGMRAEQAARHLADKLMLLQTSPETMRAGLDPMKRAFAERGTIPGAEPFWNSQGIDINDVKKFLKDGLAGGKGNPDLVLPGVKQASTSVASGEPTMEQVLAEVEERRKKAKAKAGK